jgi:hypothetical protein
LEFICSKCEGLQDLSGDFLQPVENAAPASKGDFKSCILLGTATNPSSVRPETWDNGWIL